MKKKLMVLALAAICAASIATGSLAYFTSSETVHNTITSGNIDIEVVEKMKVEGSDELKDFPTNGIEGIMPGTSVSKIVRVKNSGSAKAWIRVKVDMTILKNEKEEMPLKLQDGTEVISFKLLDGWTDGKDGYYYYEKSVASDALTDPIFESVEFHKATGNEYQNCKAKLSVYAQAVQVDNNGKTVMEAKGWSEE